MGPTGPQGAPAAGAVLGFTAQSGDLVDYIAPTGIGGGDNTESVITLEVSPNAAMVARDLYVSVSTAPGGVESRAVTLRVNRADTTLTCTMTGTVTSCNSGSATVSVPAGSLLSMKLQRSAGSPAAYVYWGFRLTTP